MDALAACDHVLQPRLSSVKSPDVVLIRRDALVASSTSVWRQTGNDHTEATVHAVHTLSSCQLVYCFSQVLVFCCYQQVCDTPGEGPCWHANIAEWCSCMLTVSSTACYQRKQEGQHPLTGQRAPQISGGT